MVGVPDGIARAGRLRGGRAESGARSGAVARRRCRRRVDEHFRKVVGRPAVLEAGARPCTSGRGICPRPPSAASSAARWRPSSRACGASPRRRTGALAGGGRRRIGTGRPGCSTSSRRCRRRPRAEVQLRQPLGRAGLRQPDVHRAGERARGGRRSRCPRASTSRRSATWPSCTSWCPGARPARGRARERRGDGGRRAADRGATSMCPVPVVGKPGKRGLAPGPAAVLRAGRSTPR